MFVNCKDFTVIVDAETAGGCLRLWIFI